MPALVRHARRRSRLHPPGRRFPPDRRWRAAKTHPGARLRQRAAGAGHRHRGGRSGGARQFQKYERLVPPLAPMLPSIVGNVYHRVAVVTFDSRPKLVQEFTSDLDEAEETLRDLSAGCIAAKSLRQLHRAESGARQADGRQRRGHPGQPGVRGRHAAGPTRGLPSGDPAGERDGGSRQRDNHGAGGAGHHRYQHHHLRRSASQRRSQRPRTMRITSSR